MGLVRTASPTLRLLTVNQFGINVGFFMLMPYLATYVVGRPPAEAIAADPKPELVRSAN